MRSRLHAGVAEANRLFPQKNRAGDKEERKLSAMLLLIDCRQYTCTDESLLLYYDIIHTCTHETRSQAFPCRPPAWKERRIRTAYTPAYYNSSIDSFTTTVSNNVFQASDLSDS